MIETNPKMRRLVDQEHVDSNVPAALGITAYIWCDVFELQDAYNRSITRIKALETENRNIKDRLLRLERAVQTRSDGFDG